MSKSIATEHLRQLQKVLGDRKEIEAVQLAKALKVSMPTVYRRIKALREQGALIDEAREPRSKPGPTPRKFILVKKAKLVADRE